MTFVLSLTPGEERFFFLFLNGQFLSKYNLVLTFRISSTQLASPDPWREINTVFSTYTHKQHDVSAAGERWLPLSEP